MAISYNSLLSSKYLELNNNRISITIANSRYLELNHNRNSVNVANSRYLELSNNRISITIANSRYLELNNNLHSITAANNRYIQLSNNRNSIAIANSRYLSLITMETLWPLLVIRKNRMRQQSSRRPRGYFVLDWLTWVPAQGSCVQQWLKAPALIKWTGIGWPRCRPGN